MPLTENEEDTGISRLCGLETYFNKSMTHIIDRNVYVDGGFDFVVVPLVSLVFFIVSNFFFIVLQMMIRFPIY
jgi:hypothetical protein